MPQLLFLFAIALHLVYGVERKNTRGYKKTPPLWGGVGSREEYRYLLS
jgi:hypothetical protein